MMKRRLYWPSCLAVMVILGGMPVAFADPTLPDFGSATFMPGAPIDNSYSPFIPGMIYTYEGLTDEGTLEVDEVLVTFDIKMILGIPCVVVRDTVWEDGELMEDTYDWYAQDTGGNVWYMGEWSTEYEYDDDGNVIGQDHAGSWEAGVDGALPGYLIKGAPAIGDSYYQEYYLGEAEDQAEVIGLSAVVSVDYGDFSGCLQTLETTALDPDTREYKYYASGLGLVLIEELDTDGDVVFTSELVDVRVVPEPASLSLAALGVASLGFIRRRLAYHAQS